MDEVTQAKFEGWAVVEMMGHRKEIGYVTTQAFGQAVLFRVDTPDLSEREFVLTVPEYIDGSGWAPEGTKVKRAAVPARSCLIAPGSLYAINPCTEEAARTAIERSSPRPLILIEVPQGKRLGPGSLPDDDYEEPGADEREEVGAGEATVGGVSCSPGGTV
jgi:hypothetical protein